MKKQLKISVSLLAMLLPACTAEHDLQGIDPVKYYSEHPIENSVEMHDAVHTVRFQADSNSLDDVQVQKLKKAFHSISPMASETVRIQLATADFSNEARRHHLSAVLRSMGYPKEKFAFAPSASISRDNVSITVEYATVITPDCPDWRRSPVTTYSNTTQGNFRCATVVNYGAMVANPRDLVRGSGKVSPYTERATRVVEQYRSGGASTATSSTAGAASSATSSASGTGDDSGQGDSGSAQ
jgi:pilus assembly protein CpaD